MSLGKQNNRRDGYHDWLKEHFWSFDAFLTTSAAVGEHDRDFLEQGENAAIRLRHVDRYRLLIGQDSEPVQPIETLPVRNGVKGSHITLDSTRFYYHLLRVMDIKDLTNTMFTRCNVLSPSVARPFYTYAPALANFQQAYRINDRNTFVDDNAVSTPQGLPINSVSRSGVMNSSLAFPIAWGIHESAYGRTEGYNDGVVAGSSAAIPPSSAFLFGNFPVANGTDMTVRFGQVNGVDVTTGNINTLRFVPVSRSAATNVVATTGADKWGQGGVGVSASASAGFHFNNVGIRLFERDDITDDLGNQSLPKAVVASRVPKTLLCVDLAKTKGRGVFDGRLMTPKALSMQVQIDFNGGTRANVPLTLHTTADTWRVLHVRVNRSLFISA